MNFFDPIQFVNNLKWMGLGMLGVFIIIGIIVAATYLTAHFTKNLGSKNNEQ